MYAYNEQGCLDKIMKPKSYRRKFVCYCGFYLRISFNKIVPVRVLYLLKIIPEMYN